MTTDTRETNARVRVWPVPIALGALSAVGLTSALVADGFGDVLAWVALGAPAVVAAYFSLPGRGAGESSRDRRGR